MHARVQFGKCYSDPWSVFTEHIFTSSEVRVHVHACKSTFFHAFKRECLQATIASMLSHARYIKGGRYAGWLTCTLWNNLWVIQQDLCPSVPLGI